MKTFKNYLLEEEQANETPSVGDVFEIEMARDETLIETTVVEVLEDGIVINTDDTVMKMFEDAGYLQEYWTGMDSVALGGNKSPVGSRSPKKPKFTEQQSSKDALAEDDTYTDKQIKMAFGIINDPRFKGGNMTEIVRRIEGIADGLSDHPSVMRAIERTNVGENAQLAEGKIKELLVDINELTHDEFSGKYNMSKDEAREKFDIEDEEELDEMSAMRRLAGMMQDKENIKNTRIPSHDERRIQVDLIDLTDEEFEAKHKMSKAQAREQFDEAHDASAEEEDKFHTELDDLVHKTFGHSSDERGEKMKKSTQDAFEELKDYAETSGGIDKEEFEKAAYLVKAMGKPHLKDKAEGMLDDLIGKMDSDPRDKVIQVLAQYIDLTFLKNLLDEAEYQGRTVKLNKPTRGDVKKFKVYVKDPKTGNVKKVNFGHGGTSAKRAGQKTMKIKKSNPARRKSFRARHNCDNPGPKTKARYWSCRAW
jgi:hypothetical protein